MYCCSFYFLSRFIRNLFLCLLKEYDNFIDTLYLGGDTMNTLLAQEIHDKALACGYDSCGIVPLAALDFYKERLTKRLEEIPESKDVYAHSKEFLSLKENYPWAESIVVCTEYFGNYRFPDSLQKRYAKGLLLSLTNIPDSVEAKRRQSFESWLGEKGIKCIGGETAKPAGVVPLRPASVAAGLGIYRKNNFFYGPKGSNYELVAYLIDKSCEYIQHTEIPPCPDSCDLCQQGCKTKSLSTPYSMNPLTCVSFINTFGDGNMPDGITEDMLEDWIIGCDNCQDVCPFNKTHDWVVGEEYPGLDELEPLLQPEHILKASEEELVNKVIPKFCLHLTKNQIPLLRQSAKRVVKRK